MKDLEASCPAKPSEPLELEPEPNGYGERSSTYVSIYIYVLKWGWMSFDTCAHARSHAYAGVRACSSVRVCTRVRKRTRVRECARTCSHVRACPCARSCTPCGCARVRVRAHVVTHARMRACMWVVWLHGTPCPRGNDSIASVWHRVKYFGTRSPNSLLKPGCARYYRMLVRISSSFES